MIKTNIIEPGSIVEFILEDKSTLEEVLDIINSQYRNISKGVLWNFNNEGNLNLSVKDMTLVAQMVKKHAKHKKTAYVGSLDVKFGLLRKYEAYASMQSVPTVMKVFRDRAESIIWINELD